ncbi:hypothetical protein ASPFODRAFT_141053, partial [Aspergillus luchuensis CBS 106.47]
GLYLGSPEASSTVNAWECIGKQAHCLSKLYTSNSAVVVAGGWAEECVDILDKEASELRDGRLMRC